MPARSLQHALEETLGSIERAVERIRTGDGGETELRDIRAYLLSMLDLVERDPGIDAASDDVFASAKALADGADKGTRMSRLTSEALLRFRDRLALARPSKQARNMGLA
jgi:hypothetical protein